MMAHDYKKMNLRELAIHAHYEKQEKEQEDNERRISKIFVNTFQKEPGQVSGNHVWCDGYIFEFVDFSLGSYWQLIDKCINCGAVIYSCGFSSLSELGQILFWDTWRQKASEDCRVCKKEPKKGLLKRLFVWIMNA